MANQVLMRSAHITNAALKKYQEFVPDARAGKLARRLKNVWITPFGIDRWAYELGHAKLIFSERMKDGRPEGIGIYILVDVQVNFNYKG